MAARGCRGQGGTQLELKGAGEWSSRRLRTLLSGQYLPGGKPLRFFGCAGAHISSRSTRWASQHLLSLLCLVLSLVPAASSMSGNFAGTAS